MNTKFVAQLSVLHSESLQASRLYMTTYLCLWRRCGCQTCYWDVRIFAFLHWFSVVCSAESYISLRVLSRTMRMVRSVSRSFVVFFACCHRKIRFLSKWADLWPSTHLPEAECEINMACTADVSCCRCTVLLLRTVTTCRAADAPSAYGRFVIWMRGRAYRYCGRRAGRQRRPLITVHALVVHPSRLSTVGDRAFPVAAARVWNSLPDFVMAWTSLPMFKRHLKTVLFAESY